MILSRSPTANTSREKVKGASSSVYKLSVLLFFMSFLHVSLTEQQPRDAIKLHKITQQQTKFTPMPPLIMISGGCVGSTAAFQILKEMIQQTLGGRVGGNGTTERMEILVPQKNPVYQSLFQNYSQEQQSQELTNHSSHIAPLVPPRPSPRHTSSNINEQLMVQAIQTMHQKAIQQHKVFVFKASWNILAKYPTLIHHFYHDMNARFSGIYRENYLDACICSVRDCLGNKHMGYPVFANNGTRSDLCFQRRSHPETKIQVHLAQPHTCTNNMKRHARDMRRTVVSALPQSIHVPFTPTERLFAAEYSNSTNAMVTSLTAWKVLLRPFFPNETASHLESSIRKVLERLQNTRTPPGPHRSVVHNMDWVYEQARADNPLLLSYVRGD